MMLQSVDLQDVIADVGCNDNLFLFVFALGCRPFPMLLILVCNTVAFLAVEFRSSQEVRLGNENILFALFSRFGIP